MSKTMKFKSLYGVIGLVAATFASLFNVSCSSNDDPDYLVIKALEDSEVGYAVHSTTSEFISTIHLSYSKDRVNWTDEWKGDKVDLKKGEKIYLFNSADTLNKSLNDYINITTSGKIEVSGNIMALINKAELSDYCFARLFDENVALVKAPKLPATNLAKDCYAYMFYKCRNLVDVPDLPATVLTEECYRFMFSGCINLKRTPSFRIEETGKFCCHAMFEECINLKDIRVSYPAKTLTEHCYDNMFTKCYSLENAPELPATTLADSCYRGMFCLCYNLKKAPSILPALSLEGADYCCRLMFQQCFYLKTAPKLPATTLASHCYEEMFADCYSLESTPELPATTLAVRCYNGMFKNCKSLVKAPDLPATTLVEYCYIDMFYGCVSLKKAPAILPSTNLVSYAYCRMFYGCSNLEIAPEIFATTMEGANCLNETFRGCSHLRYLKVHFPVSYLDGGHTKDWLTNAGNLAAHPIFYSNEISSEITRSNDTVPDYWDIQTYE